MRTRALLAATACALAAVPAASASAADATNGGAAAQGPKPEDVGGTQFGAAPVNSTPTKPVVKGFKAKIKKGIAYAPSEAPLPVKKAIWAGNKLRKKPYIYGGGHASFRSRGYDCSGTVSFALHGGGLLDSPLDSSAFMDWGEEGEGDWITIYTNPGHAYVVIAGIRLDTSAAGDPSGNKGPRWRKVLRENDGFDVRHPDGF